MGKRQVINVTVCCKTKLCSYINPQDSTFNNSFFGSAVNVKNTQPVVLPRLLKTQTTSQKNKCVLTFNISSPPGLKIIAGKKPKMSFKQEIKNHTQVFTLPDPVRNLDTPFLQFALTARHTDIQNMCIHPHITGYFLKSNCCTKAKKEPLSVWSLGSLFLRDAFSLSRKELWSFHSSFHRVRSGKPL